jgi:two-component system KDP operon response regulator KdpE
MVRKDLLAQVVDDDPAMVRFVRRNLQLGAFQVVVSSDGQAALDQFEDTDPDVVILDIGIPKLDGIQVCRHLRATSDVPVILVSSKNRDEDVIIGLEAGADDYLSKPFSAGVLLARVDAVLRRRLSKFESVLDRFECGDFVVDFVHRRVTRGHQVIHLTPTEYELVTFLVRNAGRVLTARRILTEVWGAEYNSEAATLRTHIGRLRKKIEVNAANPELILNEPGVGYWFKC